MKLLLTRVFACAAGLSALGAAYTAQASTGGPQPTAFISVTTGTDIEQIPVELRPTEKGWDWTIPPTQTDEWGILPGTGGEFNTDPSIAYAVGVVDFGAPSIFGFIFGTPIVPTGPGTVVSASVTGGLIDFEGDGIAMTPLGPDLQSASAGFPLANLGVDVGDPFTAPASTAGAPYAYGPFAEGPIAGPAGGPFTFLTTTTLFSLSGGGDTFSVTGFASINDAPVSTPDFGPGLAGILSIGGLLAVSARRRMAR